MDAVRKVSRKRSWYSSGLRAAVSAIVLAACAVCGCRPAARALNSGSDERAAPAREATLLNVSYDPTREFYQDFNAAFARHWRAKTGQKVNFEQSHGGSGKQVRAVLDGLEADVVTLALAHDIDMLARGGLVSPDWQARLPHRSAPYASTIVLLVRPGNPKQIKDWDDLVRGDTQLVAANPKTGGGARWNYLAAWGFVLKQQLGDLARLRDPAAQAEVATAQAKAREFVGNLYRRVVVLDSGARGATTTFLQRGIGDVLICWENEAYLALDELGKDQAQIVVPSISILAEPPVAVVDRNVDRHGTRQVAEAYLEFLYSLEGQTLAARRYYRPALADQIDPRLLTRFPALETFSIDEVFGGWEKAQTEHFDDGAIFDQFFQPSERRVP